MPGKHVSTEPKVRACAMLEAQARALPKTLRSERNADRMIDGDSNITLSVLRDVKDRTGAIWYMRDQEQDTRQAKKDAWAKKYRPIQTLDGLDPHWRRKYFRDVAASIEAWRKAMVGGNYG